MMLNDLPEIDVVSAHVNAFNPYAKVILNLIDIFINATPQN
jgi:hypothetical protein